MGTGLDDDATLLFDWREVIEFTPACNTLAAQVATPGKPSNSFMDKIEAQVSHVSSIFTGSIGSLINKAKSKASSIASAVMKQAGGLALNKIADTAFGYAEEYAAGTIEAYLAEGLGAAALL